MAPSRTPTVLVADDEPDVREMVRILLELDGFDVVGEVVNGAQAVKCFGELAPPPDPNVVVLDNRMPVLNGVEAAEQILATHPDQMIVLFTAHIDESLEDRARQLGVAACIDKTRAGDLPTILRGLLAAA